MNEIHKELDTSEVYDKLRQAHSLLKDIFYSENYEKKFGIKQIVAIEEVNSKLYEAERKFIDF